MGDPSLSFTPASTDFGSINVGASCAFVSYHVKNKNSTGIKTAKNISILLVNSTGNEYSQESWMNYSTSKEAGVVGASTAGTHYCQVGSLVLGGSQWVKHKVKVPSDAVSSGRQAFYGRHRYQFT